MVEWFLRTPQGGRTECSPLPRKGKLRLAGGGGAYFSVQLSPEKRGVFRYQLALEESKIKVAAYCAPRSGDSELAERKDGGGVGGLAEGGLPTSDPSRGPELPPVTAVCRPCRNPVNPQPIVKVSWQTCYPLLMGLLPHHGDISSSK